MTKADTEAYVIIEQARKEISKAVMLNNQKQRPYSSEQYHAACVLLHAGEYLCVGWYLSETNHSQFFYQDGR